jgi:hypothetical protein
MTTTILTYWNDEDLSAELRKLRRLIDDADETLDNITQMLAGRFPAAPVDRPAPSPLPPRRRRDDSEADLERTLKDEAALGARSIHFKRLAGRGALVTVNGKTFRLPRTLSEILLILASDIGESDDHLVGWKSTEDMARLMAVRKGGDYTAHAVSEAVRRLRRHLRAEGVNWFFVQTDPRTRKLRFAVHREAALNAEHACR